MRLCACEPACVCAFVCVCVFLRSCACVCVPACVRACSVYVCVCLELVGRAAVCVEVRHILKHHLHPPQSGRATALDSRKQQRHACSCREALCLIERFFYSHRNPIASMYCMRVNVASGHHVYHRQDAAPQRPLERCEQAPHAIQRCRIHKSLDLHI